MTNQSPKKTAVGFFVARKEIMASVNDKLMTLVPLWSGTIGTGGVSDASVTTVPLASASGLTEGSIYVVTIDRVDSAGTKTLSKREVVIGEVSGDNLINCLRGQEGTAQAHSAGAVVEVLFTAKQWNRLIEGIGAEHDADGTHMDSLPLTTPKITTSINDANGNEVIKTPATASAVNEITVTNAATSRNPSITATGGDTNIGLDIITKGTGGIDIKMNGADDFQFTPNTFTALSGSKLATDTIEGTTSGSGVTIPFIGMGTSTELTISSGAITITGSYHRVDTEGDAATDDLTDILGGSIGQILILRSENLSRNPTIKDGGNLYLAGDFTFTSKTDHIVLIKYSADAWAELCRSDNG